MVETLIARVKRPKGVVLICSHSKLILVTINWTILTIIRQFKLILLYNPCSSKTIKTMRPCWKQLAKAQSPKGVVLLLPPADWRPVVID